MSNLHRIIWIDRRIRNRRYPGRQTIADKYEISIRQVARDIEYMKYSLGAPIEYSGLHKGYYYSDNNFSLPSNFLTDDDRKILKYLAYQYNQKEANSNTKHSSQLAELFLRLSKDKSEEKQKSTNKQIIAGDKKRQLSQDGIESKDDDAFTQKELPVFRFSSKEAGVFDLLAKAIGKKLKIKMTYQNADFKNTERIFCPYKLFYKHRKNYVVGFCQLRAGIRIFRIDRIKDIKLLKNSFEKVSFFREEDYREEISFHFRSPYKAVIIFDKAEDANGLRYNIRYKGNGSYEIEFYDSQEFLSDIMAGSFSFTVKYPNWLRSKLKKRLKILINRNKSS